jgi:hypothetical protein
MHATQVLTYLTLSEALRETRDRYPVQPPSRFLPQSLAKWLQATPPPARVEDRRSPIQRLPDPSHPNARGHMRASNVTHKHTHTMRAEAETRVKAQVSVISSLQACTSYRYSIQPRHTFDNVVSKSFCQ